MPYLNFFLFIIVMAIRLHGFYFHFHLIVCILGKNSLLSISTE